MARIYVSSTFKDLFECREKVRLNLRQEGHEDIAMEYYGAEDKRPVDKCQEDVASSDLYIGIFAWRYGYVPDEYDKSITELEYRKAVEAGKECLIFLLREDAPWPPMFVDIGIDAEKIRALRDELSRKYLVSFFKSADELPGLVNVAIHKWETKRRVKPTETNQVMSSCYLERYLEYLINEFVNAKWTKKYQTIQCKKYNNEIVPDVHEYLVKWTMTGKPEYIFLLGEYGTGKTWIIKKLASDIATQYLDSQSCIIPLVIPVARWILTSSGHTWEQRASACLNMEDAKKVIDCALDPNANCVLMLDGLDEIATFHDAFMVNMLTSLFDFPWGFYPQIILTCRSQHYVLVEQSVSCIRNNQRDRLDHIDDLTTVVMDEILSEQSVNRGMNTLKIQPLKDTQIDAYFAENDLAKGWELLKHSSVDLQLLRKPVFLYMVEKTMPSFVSSNPGHMPVKLYDIYYTAFKLWIKRDSNGNKLNYNKIHSILEDYSQYLFFSQLPFEYSRRIYRFRTQTWDWENDRRLKEIFTVLTNVGILNKSDDVPMFSHQSFLEYFLAVRIGKEILDYNETTLAILNLVYDYTMNQFIVSYLSDKPLEKKVDTSLLRLLFENHTNNDSIRSFEASPLILQGQYKLFLDLTGWRDNIGWGASPTRCTSIGTLAIKDLNMSSFEWGRPVLGDKNKILGNVSWYDACLFSKACGGRLPYEDELKVLKSPPQNYNEYQKEWCADWYDQEMGLMKVAEWTGHSNTARVNFGGANPDVRDKSIGFRIIKDKSGSVAKNPKI